MITHNTIFIRLLAAIFPLLSQAQVATVFSPDKQVKVDIAIAEGKPVYSIVYGGKQLLEPSPLGLKTNEGDFTASMKFLGTSDSSIDKRYTQKKIKQSDIHYVANQLTCSFENGQQKKIAIVFQVSNHDVAFRYQLPTWGERQACVVEAEATGYKFPEGSTSFLSGMMGAMGGYARTAPSYESGYEPDAPAGKSRNKRDGYVFPALFHIGNDGWMLLSETGVSSSYCAAHLSDASAEGIYSVEYPSMKQNNGFGASGAAIALPGVTPWRTITVGNTLKPIVETTIPFDLVDPLYEPSQEYKYGRSTWSWIVWQDNSMNYDDQKRYIDLAASMHFEYILMDAFWDKNIGKDRLKELVAYAAGRGIGVFLWYNSNGAFNDAPQTPRNK